MSGFGGSFATLTLPTAWLAFLARLDKVGDVDDVGHVTFWCVKAIL